MNFVNGRTKTIFVADFSSSGCASEAAVKGRQILTPLQWKTHAEARQQKHYVQSVRSWADVQGLIHFLFYNNSYLCALNTGCWQITTVVFHLSAFALHLSLHYLIGKL